MSNLLAPVEAQILESVTGGSATRCAGGNSTALNTTLTQLQSTISSLSQNNNNNNGGFSTTEALMLGLMMSQRNNVVVVRHPFW